MNSNNGSQDKTGLQDERILVLDHKWETWTGASLVFPRMVLTTCQTRWVTVGQGKEGTTILPDNLWLDWEWATYPGITILHWKTNACPKSKLSNLRLRPVTYMTAFIWTCMIIMTATVIATEQVFMMTVMDLISIEMMRMTERRNSPHFDWQKFWKNWIRGYSLKQATLHHHQWQECNKVLCGESSTLSEHSGQEEQTKAFLRAFLSVFFYYFLMRNDT